MAIVPLDTAYSPQIPMAAVKDGWQTLMQTGLAVNNVLFGLCNETTAKTAQIIAVLDVLYSATTTAAAHNAPRRVLCFELTSLTRHQERVNDVACRLKQFPAAITV